MIAYRAALAASLVLLISCSRSTPVTRTDTAPADPLAELAWLSGQWESPDGLSREEWMAPRDGLMLGMNRQLAPGRRPFFEYLRIEARPDGVYYVAQPKGSPPTSFRLESSEAGRALFTAPEHDFPQRIEYSLAPDGTLRAHVTGVAQGREAALEFSWRRAPRTE
ncbi:MAG: DUF6265 family protein [Candidatus Sumerlaeia bacterium]|nr:DUF6265 family protein [Candidatus Sumerlaeia bacterium]